MFYKKGVLKNFAIFTGKHLRQGLFLSYNLTLFKKRLLWIMQDTFGGLLLFLQLLALYFATSWQPLCSEKSAILEKKTHPYISRIFHFLWEMPVYFVGYAKRILCFEQPIVLLTRRYLNTMLWTYFENLNSISNTLQETQFLTFDGPTNYFYLFKNRR